MATASDIINDLGGPTAVARKLGIPTTTVHTWSRAGHVPSWRIPALLKVAKGARKPLTLADFPAKPAPTAQDALA